MVDLLQRTEAIPDAYPDTPANLTNASLAWARVEAYIAHRWSPRAVSWIVQGLGDWAPDLTPVTIASVEVWSNSAWSAVSLDASWSGGYVLEGCIYRLTGTAGDTSPNDVPAEVQEAVKRLDAYLAEAVERHGAGRYEVDLGKLRESFDRAPAWQAKALQLSGAADLLRPYRRP